MAIKGIGRVFKKHKRIDQDRSDSSPDSSSSSNQREDPRTLNKYRNYKRPSRPKTRASSQRQPPEGSASSMSQQTPSPAVTGLGIHYDDNDTQRSPGNGASPEMRPERVTPPSIDQRQRPAADISTTRIPRPRGSAEGHPTRRARQSRPLTPPSSSPGGSSPVISSPVVSSPDCSSGPGSLTGVLPYHLGTTEDIQTAEDAIYIGKNRIEAYDMLVGKIPAQAFNMADFIVWRRERQKNDKSNNRVGCTVQHYGQPVQYRLPAQRQPAWAALPAREPPDPKARSESMKARLAEMKKMMEQSKQAAPNPQQGSPSSSRPPVSTRQPAHRPQASASSQAKGRPGHDRAPVKTTRQREDDDLQAAIAASLADAEKEKRRAAQGEGTSSPRPAATSAHQRHRQASRNNSPSSASRTRVLGHNPAREPETSSAGVRAPEPRPRAAERTARLPRPATSRRTGYSPLTTPPRSHLRGAPRDATTGEYLSEEAWDAQIL